jgi:hypothetical protein
MNVGKSLPGTDLLGPVASVQMSTRCEDAAHSKLPTFDSAGSAREGVSQPLQMGRRRRQGPSVVLRGAAATADARAATGKHCLLDRTLVALRCPPGCSAGASMEASP